MHVLALFPTQNSPPSPRYGLFMVRRPKIGLFSIKIGPETQILAGRYPLGATSLEISAFFGLSDLENGGSLFDVGFVVGGGPPAQSSA